MIFPSFAEAKRVADNKSVARGIAREQDPFTRSLMEQEAGAAVSANIQNNQQAQATQQAQEAATAAQPVPLGRMAKDAGGQAQLDENGNTVQEANVGGRTGMSRFDPRAKLLGQAKTAAAQNPLLYGSMAQKRKNRRFGGTKTGVYAPAPL